MSELFKRTLVDGMELNPEMEEELSNGKDPEED